MRLVLLALLLTPATAGADGLGSTNRDLPQPRPPSIQSKISLGPVTPIGPLGVSAEQIDRVVKVRTGVFRACHQKELNRDPTIAGKLVIRFEIGRDGQVPKATIRSTTLGSPGVASCVKRFVERLRFPTGGSTSIVTYPFVFTRADP